MTEENLKDFVVNWVLFGILFTCLISFTIFFMYENNPIGLNDGSNTILNSSNTEMSSKLYEIEGDANELLNITSNTDPETSYLGSKDSVSTSFKMVGSSKKMWSSSKALIGWVFSGEIGKILIGVFGGLIGFLSLYYINKWIRSGL